MGGNHQNGGTLFQKNSYSKCHETKRNHYFPPRFSSWVFILFGSGKASRIGMSVSLYLKLDKTTYTSASESHLCFFQRRHSWVLVSRGCPSLGLFFAFWLQQRQTKMQRKSIYISMATKNTY